MREQGGRRRLADRFLRTITVGNDIQQVHQIVFEKVLRGLVTHLLFLQTAGTQRMLHPEGEFPKLFVIELVRIHQGGEPCNPYAEIQEARRP